jgi:hypothetical protein
MKPAGEKARFPPAGDAVKDWTTYFVGFLVSARPSSGAAPE